MPKRSCVMTVAVEYDPELTDPDALASALDMLMDTALSTPDILSDYGRVKVGQFYPTPA